MSNKSSSKRKTQARIQSLALGVFVVAAILIIGYVAFTVVAKPASTTSSEGGPQFQVDAQKVDLGDQPLGKTVRATFNIKNSGDGVLTLNSARVATVLEGC